MKQQMQKQAFRISTDFVELVAWLLLLPAYFPIFRLIFLKKLLMACQAMAPPVAQSLWRKPRYSN